MDHPSAKLDLPRPPSDFKCFSVVMKSGKVFGIGGRESEIELLKQKMDSKQPGSVSLNSGRYFVLSEEVVMIMF